MASPEKRPRLEGLRRTLAEPGDPLLGTFVTIPRVEIIEALAGSGFDFAILDCEHGPYWLESLPPLLAAARGSGLTAIVRTPDSSLQGIGASLDAGADGVLVPQVADAEAARTVVNGSRLPPTGSRGTNPYIRGARYGIDQHFLSLENDRRACLVMVENSRTADQIDEIASIGELDCAFVGPYDLSASYGVPGQLDHPSVQAATDRILSVCDRSGLATGVFAATPESAVKWMRRNVRLVALSVDSQLAVQGFSAATKRVKTGLE